MFTLISDVIADNLFLFRVLGSILIFVLFWAFKGTITKAVVNLLTKLLNRSRQIADQSTLRFVLGPLKHFLAVSGLYLALMNLHPGAGWSDFFLKVYRIAVIVLISIVLLRLCDCASDNLFQPFGKQEELENRLNKTLMTLLKKAAKVLILIIAGIAVLSRTQGLRFPEYWQQDLGACTQNLLLEAEHQGLGAVWMGIAPLEERMRAVAEILGLGEGLQAFALVAVGYPAEKAAPHDRFDPSRVQWR